MIAAVQNEPALWQGELPRLQINGNKYTRGHALIMGGYPLTGAARLAARAAARIGAGLVSICVPEVALPIYAASLLSIMVLPLRTSEDFNLLMEDTRITAMLIGAGIKPCVDAKAQTLSMLASHKPVVLDAGALIAFAEQPSVLCDAIKSTQNVAEVTCVLTPHGGEFAQLFGSIDTVDERLVRVCDAAKISGAIIILKGAETLIAAPNGHVIISAHAPPSLATAGSGDVLGGIIVGLLAQGMPAFEAAAAAVWLHGAAAHLFGIGLMAEDLPDLLPYALNDL
jgi:ADP-dependent NAD(P)H-hydrate dehydratase / NAD(P)H-hydrate epimerase